MTWSEEIASKVTFTFKKTFGCKLKLENDSTLLIVYQSVDPADVTILDTMDIVDVIGAQRRDDTLLELFVYPKKQSWFRSTTKSDNAPRVAQHRSLKLDHATTTDASVDQLVDAIRQLAVQTSTVRRMLLIVNPISGGHNKSPTIAAKQVVPMLQQAHIQTTVVETTHSGHAQELAANLTEPTNNNDTRYDGIVLLGGDGIIHEVLNGLKNNYDIPIGVIGCGTANGMATTLTHASKEATGICQQVYLICKNQTVPTDIARYNILDKTYMGCLTYTKFFVSDCDIDSEVIRWLGHLRYDLWAVWRVINYKVYRGKLSYTNDDTAGRVDVNQPVPNTWKTLEAEFFLLWCSQATHAGHTLHHSPKSTLDDGVFQIFVVTHPISRYQLVKILLSLDSGSHVDMARVEWISCKRFRLQAQGSYNNIDGEVVEQGTIQGEVVPKKVPFFCTR